MMGDIVQSLSTTMVLFFIQNAIDKLRLCTLLDVIRELVNRTLISNVRSSKGREPKVSIPCANSGSSKEYRVHHPDDAGSYSSAS